MKKLIYTFAFLLFTAVFTSCTTQDPLEDISIETQENESTTKTNKGNNDGRKIRGTSPI